MKNRATRQEHLAWCKQRALEYLPDDPGEAVASMGSDMNKHPETDSPAIAFLVMVGIMEVDRGADAVRRWIEGFN